MTSIRSRRLRWLAPVALAVGSFLLVLGPEALIPTNVEWLRSDPDSTTHYLGWVFFRHAPWSIPVGMNPAYGLELSSSILYSDSIPLLALLFKPLSPWLPEPFQYFGLWVLMCFILQALFSWVLIGQFTSQISHRLAGCVLLAFTPPMLYRLHYHWALAGHWVILASLVLALRTSRRRQSAYWALLLTASALVHLYLLAMAAGIWLSSWAGDLWFRKRLMGELAMEALVVPVCVITALWQAGFFAVSSGLVAGGFGEYRFNLVAPLNPAGWSIVLPPLSVPGGDLEGFAYLGLGNLLVCGAAAWASFTKRRTVLRAISGEWLPLGIVLVGFAGYAASHRIGLGQASFTCPLPEWLASAIGVLRASGRLIWPAFYAGVLAAIVVVARAYTLRVSAGLLVAAAITQVVDTSPGWRQSREISSRTHLTLPSPLKSPFWREASAVYRRVRLVPPGIQMKNWAVFADYAARFGLATDAVLLARVEQRRWYELRRDTFASMIDGTFEPDTLYILQDGAPDVSCSVDPLRDQFSTIDGFSVLMPGGKSRFGERYAGDTRRDCPVLSYGTSPLRFGTDSGSRAPLTAGWSYPEHWGTWSVGPRSTVNLHVRGPAVAVEFTAAAFARPGPPLQVIVSVDGRRITTWQMDQSPEPRTQRLPLPAAVAAGDLRRIGISFEYSDIRPPATFGGSLDTRKIAFGLREVRVVR